MDFTIAGERWPVTKAPAVCRWYGDRYPDTLRFYDFSDADQDPHPDDTVTLADAGRLVVINARLASGDVPTMIEAGSTALACRLPRRRPAARGGR